MTRYVAYLMRVRLSRCAALHIPDHTGPIITCRPTPTRWIGFPSAPSRAGFLTLPAIFGPRSIAAAAAAAAAAVCGGWNC